MDSTVSQTSAQHCNLPIAFSSKFKCDATSTVQLASNNTLISYLKLTAYKYLLRQIGAKGQVIKQIEIMNIKYFTMASEHQVIILTQQNTKQDIKLVLLSWNLRTNALIRAQIMQHYTKTQDWQYKLFVFKKTKLLCICQYNDRLYKLLYYCLPLEEQDDPIHLCQESSSGSSSYAFGGRGYRNQNNLSIVKLNQNSMIGILNTTKISLFGKENFKFTFKTYYVTYNCKGRLIEHKFQYKLDQEQIQYIMNHNQLIAYVRDIWQFRPSIFYVEFETKLSQDPYDHNGNRETNLQQKQKVQKYYNVYWNYKQNIVLKNQLNIKQAHKIQFLQSIRNINEVRNQNNVNNQLQQQPLPIYYVNPQRQEIVSYFSGELENYQKGDQSVTKFSYPNNYPEYILDYRFNHYSREMSVNVRCYPPHFYGARVVSTFFLLEIDENTDEDLIIEVGYMFGGREYEEEQDKDQISKRFLEAYKRKNNIKINQKGRE